MMFQSRVAQLSLFVAVLLACGLGFAYYVQYVLHIEPCAMCYMQRYLFMGGICLCLLVAVFHHKCAVIQYVALMSLIANLGFSVYHSGVEQKWWKGPEHCTSGSAINLANLTQEQALEALKK
ncbi:MAG: disulfide bond formation protein B, partial [Alphaproteobacteria bacterium]|nr:disulfide bond formation protein B [Alphaproteobacteria bacterium]